MSADNWTQCPKCHDEWLGKCSAETKRLEESYGKVPPAQYMEMVAELEVLVQNDPSAERLREDYEQGIVRGQYFVSYRGACETCGWSFTHKHEENAYVPAPPLGDGER